MHPSEIKAKKQKDVHFCEKCPTGQCSVLSSKSKAEGDAKAKKGEPSSDGKKGMPNGGSKLR